GFAGLPAYVASKHGVVGLTRAAAMEYASQGIRINAICPGSTRTPMLEGFIGGDPQVERMMTRAVPLGRLGRPDEIAEAGVWWGRPSPSTAARSCDSGGAKSGERSHGRCRGADAAAPARPARISRARVPRLHRARGARPVVGPARVHDDAHRARPPGRRSLPVRDATSGRRAVPPL